MAEQTYDLTQQGAEVQAIINDANNCKGAGAQTTLTTESILLKDTNGQYHKILKSSFTEAIRDTLAGLLVNNDKGTTINQIAAIASGDFGSVTPANLASVLGVMPINIWNPTGGVDGIKETCLARMGGQTIKTDAYTYSNQYGVAFTQILGASDNEYACQYFLAMGAQPMLFYRQTSGILSSLTWPETWSIVYGSSLLGDSRQMSSLASALGVDTYTKNFFLNGQGTTTSSGIEINQTNGGCTALIVFSTNTSAGIYTNSVIGMLQFYYDGNHLPSYTKIAGSNIEDFIEFGSDANGFLTFTTKTSSAMCLTMVLSKRV